MTNFLNRFFTAKGTDDKINKYCQIEHITLTAVERKRNLNETDRKKYATELLDTYYGFGLPYLKGQIESSFKSTITRNAMLNLAVSLPLLEKFIRTTSKVYAINPTRKFYQNGKEILKEKPNAIIDPSKYIENAKLYDILNDLYNDNVSVALKEAEKLTNLLNVAPYKVITDKNGKIKILFIPNDSIQICENKEDVTVAETIAFIKDQFDSKNNLLYQITEEIWSPLNKSIPDPITKFNVIEVNEAGKQATKLYGNNNIGSAFAPFVIFRDAQPTVNFWDIKGANLVDYINSINMSLTELRYLTRYTTFGLKYTVNMKMPKDGISDPTGIINFAIDNSGIPGSDGDKNWAVGEFDNSSKIKELIESIIFNMKMVYDIRDINLDSLITTNSVRSAESKEQDNKNLFSWINSQREIWNLNEQNLFKVMCSVHNRDNTNKIPKGIELQVNFEELDTSTKTNEDWMVEIQNDISTYLDWLSDKNPDLDRDELIRLLEENRGINSVKNPVIEGEEDEEETESENNDKEIPAEEKEKEKEKEKKEVKDELNK